MYATYTCPCLDTTFSKNINTLPVLHILLLPHFLLSHFLPLRFPPALSTPAISTPAFLPCRIFHSCIFSAPFCLFVCLSMNVITWKVFRRFSRKFMEYYYGKNHKFGGWAYTDKRLANTKRPCNCSVLCLRQKSSLCSCLHSILYKTSFGSSVRRRPSVRRASMHVGATMG